MSEKLRKILHFKNYKISWLLNRTEINHQIFFIEKNSEKQGKYKNVIDILKNIY